MANPAALDRGNFATVGTRSGQFPIGRRGVPGRKATIKRSMDQGQRAGANSRGRVILGVGFVLIEN